MTELQEINSRYQDDWLDRLDGRTEVAQRMRQRFKSLADSVGNTSDLTHQHKSFITRILWLEDWLEKQETQLATAKDFKAGQWIQGTNALIGLYSRLDDISKRVRRVDPITITVIKPKHTESQIRDNSNNG